MRSFIKFVLAFAFVAALLVGGIVLGQNGTRYATAQDNSVTTPVCQSENSLVIVTTFKQLDVYARPNSLQKLANPLAAGKFDIGECVDSVQPTVVRYQWIETGDSVVGYVKQADLAQAMIVPPTPTPVGNNGSAAEATANAGAGLDIIVVGEGTLVNGAMHVPYASLVSLWNGNVRMTTLTLCLNDAGCDVTGKGDTRYYTFRDGGKIPANDLSGWIQTQAVYFNFATQIVSNFGVVIWTKAV